jgi:hypothetical protein
MQMTSVLRLQQLENKGSGRSEHCQVWCNSFVEDWLRSLAVTSTGKVMKRHSVEHILRVSRWTISQGSYDVTDKMR